jgi:hypothetical protein
MFTTFIWVSIYLEMMLKHLVPALVFLVAATVFQPPLNGNDADMNACKCSQSDSSRA